ncbi:MAG: S9 family peptidase, partial [Bacteroidota bacterium]
MGLNNHLITLLVLSLLVTACEQDATTNETSAVNYANIEVNYPTTEKQDVVDNYHGTDVVDSYRWLEDDRSEETGAWVAAQNEATFGYLEQIPFREQMERRLTELVNYARTSSPFRVGDHYFFSKNDGLQNQAVIYIQDGLEGEPRVFIDPNQLNEEGTTSIGLMGADKTNRYMAYSRSDAGSDWRKMYVRDIETNTDLEDELEWVKFSGAAWYGDGFFYSRYPAPAEGDELKGDNTMHSVYYHKLGTPQSEDKLIFNDEANPAYYHFGYTTEEEDFFILNQQPGTDGFAVYVLDLRESNALDNPSFDLLFDGFSNKNYVVHNEGEDFWVQTDYEAPNYRLVKMKVGESAPEAWTDVLPESENLLQSVSTGGGYFFAQYLEKATDHVYRMNYDGSDMQEVNLPGLG